MDLRKHKNIDDEECSGLVDLMDALTTKQNQLKRELKEIEKQIEQAQFHMVKKLEDEKLDNITCGFWTFGWSYKNRVAFDQSAFKKEHPDMYEKFKTTKEIKTFNFGHWEENK